MEERIIIPADPKARKKAIILLVILFGISIVFMVPVITKLDQLNALSKESPERAFQLFLECMWPAFWFSAFGGVVIAGYMFNLGLRIRREQRFPPTGMPVVRDTVLRTGPKAITMSWAAMAVGLAMLVGPVVMWFFLKHFIHHFSQLQGMP